MATRRWMINPQEKVSQITEAVGAATASKSIELTVDFDAISAATGAGPYATKAKMLVLDALEKLKERINTGNWPPA